MATPRYLSVTTFKAWWKTDRSADDDLIEAAINAAETAIDNALQRRMITATGTASARSYAADGCTSMLWVHDSVEIESVVENGVTLTAGTHYQAEPLNGLNSAGESVPYHLLRRLDQSWYVDGPKAAIVVTADWGWSAIPFEVVESCKIITADMLSNRDLRNGLVAITEAGGVGSRENRTVRDMISSYRYPRPMVA